MSLGVNLAALFSLLRSQEAPSKDVASMLTTGTIVIVMARLSDNDTFPR